MAMTKKERTRHTAEQQTKILAAGCFGPGACAVCDTVTVTGVGVTVVSDR